MALKDKNQIWKKMDQIFFRGHTAQGVILGPNVAHCRLSYYFGGKEKAFSLSLALTVVSYITRRLPTKPAGLPASSLRWVERALSNRRPPRPFRSLTVSNVESSKAKPEPESMREPHAVCIIMGDSLATL